MIEVSSNKDETTFPLFSFFPESNFFTEFSAEEHMNALEDIFFIHSLHGQDTFVSEQVFSLVSHKTSNPLLQFTDIEFTFKL